MFKGQVHLKFISTLTTNLEPIETFNVDPLSAEDEMDAVNALLSLSGIRDEGLDPTTENEQIMPIDGANLPIDLAPVPIELDQAQVDHAIAKLMEQEKEQAAAEQATDKNIIDPVAAATPKMTLIRTLT